MIFKKKKLKKKIIVIKIFIYLVNRKKDQKNIKN